MQAEGQGSESTTENREDQLELLTPGFLLT
jgi:hypothetical protein